MLKKLLSKLQLWKGSTDFMKKEGSTVPNIPLLPGEKSIVEMPKIGEHGVYTVKEVFFKVGDIVKPGQVLMTVENHELYLEFESFCYGRITTTPPQGKIKEGTVLFSIEGIAPTE